MHEAKLGIWSDCQGSPQTTHGAVGTVEGHKDTGIGTAWGLVDKKNGALTEADDALCRGAHDRLRIGSFAWGTDQDQISLRRDAFPDDGTKWVPRAHDGAGRRCNAQRWQLGDLVSKERFRAG